MNRMDPLPRRALLRRALAAALLAIAVLVPASTARAASGPWTPGDIVVYRVGNGSGTLTSAANPVFLDEYGPSGTQVQGSAGAGAIVALPTSTNAPNYALTASGTATSEGLLTLSPNGNYLGLSGYSAPVGTASVASTSGTTYPRTVGIVDTSGKVDTSTGLTDFSSGNNPRSAVTTDGTKIWVGGGNGGVRYATDGASTSTQLSTTTSNVREVSVAGGQLYTSSQSGGITVGTVGSGLPTTSGQTITNLPFSKAPAAPNGYAFLTLGTGSAPDTLYVADSGAVGKYSLQSGSWVSEGSVTVGSGISGVTANDVNGTVTIYATTLGSGTSGSLYSITDQSGQGGTLSGTAQLIATAPSNEAFRGVAFAPGTTIGSGPGTPPVVPAISTADTSLAAAIDDPTNPTLGVTVSDANYAANQLTVTASAGNSSIAADAAVSGNGANRTLTVTPGSSTGTTPITLTVTAPDGTNTTTQVTYGLSADQGDPSDRYYAGAGNMSTEIPVGGGYFIGGDDDNNVLRLYQADTSGPPVATFDFTGSLPYGASSADIEAAAQVGNVIYWLGSQSTGDSGNPRPAANTLFATRVNGTGANTTLTYLGSYTGLRSDLISWDQSNGNPLGLAAAASASSKSANGLNIEGLEFAPGSTSTAYLAFRAPLEPYNSGSEALLVPVTNLPSLIGASAGSATFGSPIEQNLGGLAIREIRKNADDQYLIVAGTADGTNSPFALYTWDGQPADAPTLTNTTLPQVAGGAWEGIVSVPDPISDGSAVRLVEDNGDSDWYGTGATSKNGLPTGLQKDLGRTFTVSLPTQKITFDSTPPSPGVVGDTYAVSASASSGDPVSYSIDSSSTNGACTLNAQTVSFTGPGTCVVDADQAGGIDAQPAQTAMQTITVAAAPSVQINTPQDGATYYQGQTVDADYSCTDGTNGPGVQSCTDSQGDGQGNPIDTTDLGTQKFKVTATSQDGATTSQSVTYTIAAPPTVTINAPQDGATYYQGQVVDSDYSCAEASNGPGIASCTDNQGGASGDALDTSKVQTYTFAVTATSQDGAQTSQSVSYTVAALSNAKPPHVVGTPQDGQTLSATTGQWNEPSSNLTFTYQWEKCSSADQSTCTPINGATGSSYTPTAPKVGQYVTVVVTATDANGYTAKATAQPVGPVQDPPAPVNSAKPKISGTFAKGSTLSATTGTWQSPDPLTYAYQWKRCTSPTDPGTCTAITGANRSRYTLTGPDYRAGSVRVAVTATDSEGQSTTTTSAAYPKPK